MSNKIFVVNTKGGASKSTVAFQVCAASFLRRKKEVKLIEFDDENKDSETFSNSAIKTEQVEIGTGSDIDEVLRETLLIKDSENRVFDVGGNKTTSLIIEGLRKTRLYKKISLFVIPLSGGYQDLVNAKKTYDLISSFGVPIIFALSRVRNPNRLQFQYGDFFKTFPNEEYFILTDSDVIDLSRKNKKSVFEISQDQETKKKLEKILDKAFDENNNLTIARMSIMLQVVDESQEYLRDILTPAFNAISKYMVHEEK